MEFECVTPHLKMPVTTRIITPLSPGVPISIFFTSIILEGKVHTWYIQKTLQGCQISAPWVCVLVGKGLKFHRIQLVTARNKLLGIEFSRSMSKNKQMVLKCNVFLEEILHKLRCHLHPSSKTRLLPNLNWWETQGIFRKKDTSTVSELSD